MTSPLPSGTVTFLFTDIEGSTQLWEAHPQAMRGALARHDALLRQAVQRNGGYVVKGTGDGLHAAFARAADGLMAAREAQEALQREAWSEIGHLHVRMGVTTGEAEERAGDYYGRAPNRAARLMASAHGGQILVAQATAELVRDQLAAEMGLRDLGEHRLKDLSRGERIYQLVAPGLAADFPPLQSLDDLPNNLPAQLSSFVGRERELAEVRSLLQNTRLLTLTGPGGTGKTRLSLQVAAEILDQFSDGVWLVELAPLADPALVAQSMAGTLGVHQQPGRPPLATLGDYLRSKRLLLVLDNCEHLLDACAELADALLRAAPHLKIMTSSREVLGIAGEVAYRVPPLALPESAEASPRMLLRSDCVRLFYERAQAANSAFVLTEQNARAIVEICRRLDGIPLAIELAAARVRLLKVEQIASRLDDRFRLLSGGSRTALPRQQTLQALVDWSWDLLESRDQILLRRLAVFSGGWTLEAAEFICTDSSPAAPAARPKEEPSTHTFDSGNVLDLLGELVDKSLVVVLEQEKKTRFDMLQTIRQYALERLVAASEAALVRDRHLRYYGELGERAERHLLGPQQIEWLKQLDDDRDNLREAVRWGITANPEQALRLCGAIGSYWVRRGLAREGYELTHAALTTDATRPLRADQTDDIRRAARARALAGISLVSVALGLNDESAKAGLEAAELFRTLGDTERQVLAISSAVTAHGLLGDEATAEALAQDAILLAQRLGGPDARRISVQMRARAAFFRGAKPEGEQLLLDGLQMVRELGPTWESAMILLILGIVAEDQGRVADARDYFLESEQIFRDLGDRHFVNMAVSERAHLERRTGRLPAAIDLYRHTLPRWQELGHRPAVAHQLESMAQVFLSQEGPEQSRAARLERAALLLGAAERIRQESGSVPTGLESEEYDDMVMRMREQMGKSAMERGRLQGRAMSLDDAVTFALEPHEVGGPDVGLQGSGANA